MVPSSEEFSSLAARSRMKAEEVEDLHPLAVVPTSEVALYPAAGSALKVEEVAKLFYLAVERGVKNEEAQKVLDVAVHSGMKADEVLSLAVRTGLKAEEEVHALLLQQLLASFDRRRKDPELFEWEHPPVIDRKKQDPRCPFFLFKMKASAKNAQVSWRLKKHARFPPERAGYTNALRVARLAAGPDGFHLEQAGEGWQPGAISGHADDKYIGRRRGKDDPSSPMPLALREVAVIRRLPRGDGISIMSYVRGLGVKVHDILFMLHCYSITVAMTFTERWFYVSSRFTEEPLYARDGLDFIDITVTLENLIKKLYQMYEQDEQEKEIMHQKQDHQDTETLVGQQKELMLRQREEQERKKLEDLQRRRADTKKQKCLRKELKEAAHRMNEGTNLEEQHGHSEDYDDASFCSPIFQLLGESDWVNPSEEELCQGEVEHKDLLEETMEAIEQN